MKKKKLLKLSFSHMDVEGFSKAKFPMNKIPWPIPDNSIEEISCLMRLQYVEAMDRPKVMDEMYRVLVKGGKVHIAVPYWSSPRSVQDYEHKWPPFAEQSFMYFNKAWRDINHPDRKFICDFEPSFSYQADADVASKNDETRSYMIKHYNNAVNDLIVVMTKK